MTGRMILASLLCSAACSTAAADQVAGPGLPPNTAIAIGVAPVKVRAPYDVQIIRQNGDTLPTYPFKDRYYVQGNDGERYVIRVTNPTPNRVEAVVTVDGLDVIDGENGDLKKRGYIVPPYGDVRIEGFRTSIEDVATFRFSSVDDSYAGKKGKARNVGVIAVAIFEEQHSEDQQIIVGPTAPPPPPGYRPPYDYKDDLDSRGETTSSAKKSNGGVARADKAPAKEKRAAPPAQTRPAPAPPAPGRGGGGATAGAPRTADAEADYGGDEGRWEEAPAPRTNRPGLGTEFGEQRYSAASYTRFVRANNRPIAIAELRYNDAAGLIALGIHMQPLPDTNELMTRETADPFPGDGRFSVPPGR